MAFAYMGTLLALFDESGEAGLDDPIGKWLPELGLPGADRVTLEMLARSTSGYPDHVRDDAFADGFLEDPFRHYTPEDLVEIGLSVPPWYEPGQAWNYSHTNYVILGAALTFDLAVAIVAVAGQRSEVAVNHAEQIWTEIAGELTPEHVPQR